MIRILLPLLLAGSGFVMHGTGTCACYPLHSDEIQAGDLVGAIPAFKALPPTLRIAYSPLPGIQRLFSVAELQQIANRNGIPIQIKSSVCLSWTLCRLSKKQIEEGIRRSLPNRQVDVEITDQSRFLAPEGELTLPLRGLTGESEKPVVWNGFVTYAATRRFDTWVRVRVTVHEDHLLARRAIKAGELIEDSALETIHYEGPLSRSAALNKTDIIGKSARWNIPAGVTLLDAMLAPPLDVENRQLVTVHVVNGATRLETQGIAGDGGYRGAVIRVHNVKTGRIFRARIDDSGVVTVVPGGNVGLVAGDGKS